VFVVDDDEENNDAYLLYPELLEEMNVEQQHNVEMK
jgi:hypothetical protein